MKVLVLNGSPKKDNSDTMHMTRAFLEGMDAVHVNEVTVLHAVDQVVKPCLGCFACKKNGGTCMLEDDMADILRQILASDLLIWSFPLYCFGMPAPLEGHHRPDDALVHHGDAQGGRPVRAREPARFFQA